MAQAVAESRHDLTDEALARLVGEGDPDALAELYERHVDGLHDFTVWNLHDRDLARDVVQDVFVKAWEHLQHHETPQNVRAWLYTVARNRAIDEHRKRRREVLAAAADDEGDRPDPFATLAAPADLEPESALRDKEIADVFWSSVGGLTVQERTLLDLHLRRGLSADDIAGCLGLGKGAVYTRLSRLKDTVERSVTVGVLVRRGRGDCPALDAIVEGAGSPRTLTPPLRRSVQRHLASCERCTESRKRYTSAQELFSAVPLFLPSAKQREEMWRLCCSRLGIDSTPLPSMSRHPSRPGQGVLSLGLQLLVCLVVASVVALALTWPARRDFEQKERIRHVGQLAEFQGPRLAPNDRREPEPPTERRAPARRSRPADEIYDYGEVPPAAPGYSNPDAGNPSQPGSPGSPGSPGESSPGTNEPGPNPNWPPGDRNQ